jgi:archaellum component FlaC
MILVTTYSTVARVLISFKASTSCSFSFVEELQEQMKNSKQDTTAVFIAAIYKLLQQMLKENL